MMMIIEYAYLDKGIENLMRFQLNNMQLIQINHLQNSNHQFDPILHMGRDHYEAYSIIMDIISKQ